MRWSLAVLAMALVPLSGCATHYYEIQGNTVSVYLKHEDAQEVEFLTSLHHFRPRSSERVNGGTWVNRIKTDTEFRYFYRIDGEVFLPECEYKENDDFGAENCIFVPEDVTSP